LKKLCKILIKGLKIFAYHGVHKKEKNDGQDFILDINIWINAEKAVKKDDIKNTVNYSSVAKVCKKTMLGNKWNLIETVAEKVALKILKKFSIAKKVKVLLKKPKTSDLEFEYMAVEIIKSRDDI
jgi:dihydroneopterin aldolase